MGDDAVFAAQQRRVTEQLGAAMLAAVGLMVRQYLGAPTGENEGQDSADAAWEDGAQAFRAGETVNESFDMARYLRLRQGASAAEPEESEGRADAEDRSRSVRRTAEKTTSARTAAGDAGARGSGERSASAAAPESGAGVLVHPVWMTTRAYFTELEVVQEPLPDYVRYRFAFCEAGSEGAALKEVSTSAAGGSAAGTAGARYHTVVQGDTLWAIAARNGTTVRALCALNPQIANPNRIYPGERVRLS